MATSLVICCSFSLDDHAQPAAGIALFRRLRTDALRERPEGVRQHIVALRDARAAQLLSMRVVFF